MSRVTRRDTGRATEVREDGIVTVTSLERILAETEAPAAAMPA